MSVQDMCRAGLTEGIPLKRLEELCQAERENRCVVLPRKVGDTVSAMVNRPYNGHAATICGEVSDIQTIVRVSHSGCRHVDFLASDFGKTVFLTREEAANALKGEGYE